MGTHVDRALKRRWAAEKSGMRLGGSHMHTRTHTHAHPSPTTPLGIKSPCDTQDAPTGFEPGWAASPLGVLPLSHWLVRHRNFFAEQPNRTPLKKAERKVEREESGGGGVSVSL